MFTGIIAELGTVADKTDAVLTITTSPAFADKLALGDSIAINGVCLTATSVTMHGFSIEYMPETARLTTIGDLKKNSLVNLELPPTPSTFLSGHIVQGHIDAVARLEHIERQGNSRILTFSIDTSAARYIIRKGSIAINGISLTVVDAGDTMFTVAIIPHTWDHTMLHTLPEGANVNIETDVLARYAEHLAQAQISNAT